MRRAWRGAVAIAAVAAVVAVGCSSGGGTGPTAAGGGGAGGTAGPPGSSASPGSPAAGGRPNIVFLLTDDMRLDDLAVMPHVRQLLGDQGMTFTNELDNVTLCCPARTAILRGQYSHNTGVLTNGGTNGGFETAYRTGVERDTVATALHTAGYRTGLFGKYLNGYPNTASTAYVPPGWDTWSSSVKGNAYGEFSYTLNQDGTAVDYGRGAEDYGTDVYFRQATDFATRAGRDGVPFFAYVALYAPHQPATPAPRHQGLFADRQAPRDPAFDEADVSDKPAYIRDAPRLTDGQMTKIDELYRRRLRSLQAVDEDAAALVDALRASGQLDNTYVVFTSDNGFHLGQHRLPSGKQTAYETDIHLPLLVRGPGVTPGSSVDALTGNVDLAPTFADLAGAHLTDDPDGRSLVPLLRGAPPADWRQAFLLEHWTETSGVPDDEAAAAGDGSDGPQLEPPDPDQEGGSTTTTAGRARRSAARSNIPEYQGLRTGRYTYVEYATGERELYDLAADPDELDNLAGRADAGLLTALHARLDELRHCRGDACRSTEARPVG